MRVTVCFSPPPPRSRIMHDCSEQINFQSSSLEKERFHLFVLRYYPWCCYSNCQQDHCAEETVNSELAGCRRCMYLFFNKSTPYCFSSTVSPSTTTASWTPAYSIWSRLWTCSVPGSRTLTAKALLSTDELSERTPSPLCVISACLRLPMSTRTLGLCGALFLFSSDINQRPLKNGGGEQRVGKNVKLMLTKREPGEARLWWENRCLCTGSTRFVTKGLKNLRCCQQKRPILWLNHKDTAILFW